MNIIQIRKLLDEGKNIMIYSHDVNDFYLHLKNEYDCINLYEPTPTKYKIIKCLKHLQPLEDINYSRFNQLELRDKVLDLVKNNTLILFFNHFDQLTFKSAQIYHSLYEQGGVLFICSFNSSFKEGAYHFYKTFSLVNKEEYEYETGKNEINISYTIYGVFSLMAFLIYLNASSMSTATLILGAAWFGLIIFRTLVYAGGRL